MTTVPCAKPCRVAARFRPAMIAVEYAVAVSGGRVSKRVYEMRAEELVCAGVDAEAGVSFLLASPAWPKQLAPDSVSRQQLERLYRMIQKARQPEAQAQDQPQPLPELRASREPELFVKKSELRSNAAARRYHGLGGSAEDLFSDDLLRLSCTGDALPRHLRLSVNLEPRGMAVVFDEEEEDVDAVWKARERSEGV
jgi:hypothetical protein